MNKVELARSLGVSRASLYYVPRKQKHDWELKSKIEAVLRKHPAYGSRRLAIALSVNRKRVKRVMRRFGIKPYRRRGKNGAKQRTFRSSTPTCS